MKNLKKRFQFWLNDFLNRFRRHPVVLLEFKGNGIIGTGPPSRRSKKRRKNKPWK